MMVPEGVYVEHEVVKCGMLIVNDLKRENELLRKEVGEIMLQNINKEKGVIKVQRMGEDS